MTEVSPTPRPLKNARAGKLDAIRRPQAAVLYRALQDAGEKGLAWRECLVLYPSDEWVEVGLVVVWLRARGVSIGAPYDSVLGETRFVLSVENAVEKSLLSGDNAVGLTDEERVEVAVAPT